MVAKLKPKISQANDFFIAICKSILLPVPSKEYKFCPSRRWRCDYAWVDLKIAIELEGGIWIKGRHISPRGFIKDMEKYNMLAEYGWTLLRYDPNAIDWDQIQRVINSKGKYFIITSVDDAINALESLRGMNG